MNTTVLYEVHGPLGWIMLNRPAKLNAINTPMVDLLQRYLAEAVADDAVRVIVLTGAGRAFCSGYDITDELEEPPSSAWEWRKVLEKDNELTMNLWACPKPTIAAVQGWVLAGGCELAMACDLIVASEDAKFGEPEIRYGSGPVTLLMPFILGQKITNELLLTGGHLTADQALAAGLVNKVVPVADLESAVRKLAMLIVPTAPAVLRLTKLALNRAYEAMGLRQAVQENLEISAILNDADTPEQREFDRIAAEAGLKGALQWRDSRYNSDLPE